MMPKVLVEFVGAFFLVCTVGLVVSSGTPLAPLAIGAILTACVYMGGWVSGAHYNPAVSFSLLLRGKMPSKDFVPYVVAQLLGAMAATFAVKAMIGSSFAPAPSAAASSMQALLAEFLFTFILCLVVLNVAATEKTSGNDYYGLAIGITVMAGAFAVGGISGGVFNPAVGTGPILVHAMIGGGSLGNLWLYWVGPVSGGVVAALLHRIVEGKDGD